MKPNIRYIGTPDGNELEPPDDPSNFFVMVRAVIGPEGEQGEELFDFFVCTPSWLDGECERKGYFLIRRFLAVSHWDAKLIRSAIENIVASVTGDSWSELASKLTAIAYWEFEDYRDAR